MNIKLHPKKDLATIGFLKNYPVEDWILTTDRYILEKSTGIDLPKLPLVNNKLVAWGLTHDDGSLGFLQVLDAHRNKGLGQQILLELIRQKRELKEAVFGNIIPENLVSKHLVEKLGFEIDRKMSWIKLKKYGQKA